MEGASGPTLSINWKRPNFHYPIIRPSMIASFSLNVALRVHCILHIALIPYLLHLRMALIDSSAHLDHHRGGLLIGAREGWVSHS